MIERWNRDQVFEFYSFVVVTTAAALAIVATRHDYPVVHPRDMRTRPGKPEPRAHLTPLSKVRSAHNAAAAKPLDRDAVSGKAGSGEWRKERGARPGETPVPSASCRSQML